MRSCMNGQRCNIHVGLRTRIIQFLQPILAPKVVIHMSASLPIHGIFYPQIQNYRSIKTI